jgi:hypothetical protein
MRIEPTDREFDSLIEVQSRYGRTALCMKTLCKGLSAIRHALRNVDVGLPLPKILPSSNLRAPLPLFLFMASQHRAT